MDGENRREGRMCFVGECAHAATHVGEAHIGQWRLRVYLCAEHHRELEKGTPMSGLAADPCRIEVEATSISALGQYAGLMPVSPQ